MDKSEVIKILRNEQTCIKTADLCYRSCVECPLVMECKIIEAYDTAIEMLIAQPEIIHCKDCKNSEHWYRDRRRCFLWSEDGVSVFDDGFCNYAERRANETD